MNKLYECLGFLSIVLMILMPMEALGQNTINKQIEVCSEGCEIIGKEGLKKHTYDWRLNGEGMHLDKPGIEICNTSDGDIYILREWSKKGKLVETLKFEIQIINSPIKISPIGPCVLSGEPAEINVIGEFKEYKWSTGETTKSIVINSDKTVSLEVVDMNDCVSVKEIDVKKSASNDIRDRLLKEGFHEIPIRVIKKEKKKN